MRLPYNFIRRRYLDRGFSLVELLVSLLLGLILSAGVVSAYLGAKRNLYYEEQMARMQENGRYAMRLLSRELGMAGFFAGAHASDTIAAAAVGVDCSDRRWVLDSENPLELVNDYAGQSVPVSLHATPLTCLDSAAIVLDTDLIAVKRTAGEASLYKGVPVAGLTTSTIESWYLRRVSGKRPEWEKLSSIDLLDRTRAVPSLGYWEAISRIIFVRKFSDSGIEGDDIPTLCMETLAGNAMTSRCLVEGVENMQLEFGIDTDADGIPNQYKSAPDAQEMARAVTAKVYLLLRSINQVSGHTDDKAYALGQKILKPRNDSYLRRVVSTTVLLRNLIEPIINRSAT
jgi:type IV pilus assembly protein PilW